MKLYLTSAYGTHDLLDRLIELSALDSSGRHELCSCPADADAILFVENTHYQDYFFRALIEHPLVSRYPEKVFMYNEADKPWCVLPGLYCSMSSRFFQDNRQVAFPYIKSPNPYISDVRNWDIEKKWLFSFVGSTSHRCRKQVVALADNSKGIKDTSDFNVWDSSFPERQLQGMDFAQTMAESRYMLCPRGIGTSSYRLFETMEAQRAPVVISDHWVQPPHVDWDFLVTVKQDDIKKIPELLRSISNEAEDRGKAARLAWEQAYGADVMFDTVAESIAFLLYEQKYQEDTDKLLSLRKFIIGSELLTLAMLRQLKSQLL
ncbi:MAG: exostosin family protein [Granulosicoccaceae bacterium]